MGDARKLVRERVRSGERPSAADVLRELELAGLAPGRSTVYRWYDDEVGLRDRDTSGRWSLATDETGHPDIVMDVLAALMGHSPGRVVTVSEREAWWIVRLATALPAILTDGTVMDATGTRPDWGTLRVWRRALSYVDAETSTDRAGDMARLDASMAILYGAKGRHFGEALGAATDEPVDP